MMELSSPYDSWNKKYSSVIKYRTLNSAAPPEIVGIWMVKVSYVQVTIVVSLTLLLLWLK